MKRLFVITIFSLALALPASLFAGGSSPAKCETKYPVVLVHGMGASATISLFGLQLLDYWWGIPGALEDEGADVYITTVNGMDSTAAKAAALKPQVLRAIAASGKSKVNIIAHSHGTLYSRYMISNLGMATKVASYTSMCGPHRGSKLADLIMYGVPDALVPVVAGALDIIYAFVFGDTSPDSLQNGYDVCTDYMTQVFNPNTPNKSGIYYQSWGAKVKWAAQSVIMEPTWLIMLGLEGANDGLVGVTSAPWGNFRGIIEGDWWASGVDHMNFVDQVLGVYVGFDAPDFYVDVVENLKNRGY